LKVKSRCSKSCKSMLEESAVPAHPTAYAKL
jgi:hypothetical protein